MVLQPLQHIAQACCAQQLRSMQPNSCCYDKIPVQLSKAKSGYMHVLHLLSAQSFSEGRHAFVENRRSLVLLNFASAFAYFCLSPSGPCKPLSVRPTKSDAKQRMSKPGLIVTTSVIRHDVHDANVMVRCLHSTCELAFQHTGIISYTCNNYVHLR